jgi:predicted transcriptional regulator
MIRTQIQLTEAQATILKKMAKRQRQSMAALIRQAIDRLVSASDNRDMQARRERAMAAAGKFRSGIRDLSANHDQYLTEAFKP